MSRNRVGSRPIVVSICGPSGTGKSQLAKVIVTKLGDGLSARVPTDYFLMPATEPLRSYLAVPLRYDWALLARVLALPVGTPMSTPDFDFTTFQRRDVTGGLSLTLRPIMVTDAIYPYSGADAAVLLSAPDETRRERIARRDEVWGTRVIERWTNLGYPGVSWRCWISPGTWSCPVRRIWIATRRAWRRGCGSGSPGGSGGRHRASGDGPTGRQVVRSCP